MLHPSLLTIDTIFREEKLEMLYYDYDFTLFFKDAYDSIVRMIKAPFGKLSFSRLIELHALRADDRKNTQADSRKERIDIYQQWKTKEERRKWLEKGM